MRLMALSSPMSADAETHCVETKHKGTIHPMDAPKRALTDRRQFLAGLTGFVLASEAGCLRQESLQESPPDRHAKSPVLPEVQNLPAGALQLTVSTKDNTPAGVLKMAEKIFLCVGETRCSIANVFYDGKAYSMHDKVLPDCFPHLTVKTMITGARLGDDGTLYFDSVLGSASVDTMTQQNIVDTLQKEIADIHKRKDTVLHIVLCEEVAYTLHLNAVGNSARQVTEYLGGAFPPSSGSCDLILVPSLVDTVASGTRE